jgi:NAD(P)-dependent dehydrogenase (short-subunit alcohol dehydrogenase family)
MTKHANSAPRRVLITGAGSGLGRALALRYARAGDRVACVDLRLRAREATRAQLPGSGHLALAADVGDDARWKACTPPSSATGAARRAGQQRRHRQRRQHGRDHHGEWRRILEVDLLSVVRGCRLFLPGCWRRAAAR